MSFPPRGRHGLTRRESGPVCGESQFPRTAAWTQRRRVATSVEAGSAPSVLIDEHGAEMDRRREGHTRGVMPGRERHAAPCCLLRASRTGRSSCRLCQANEALAGRMPASPGSSPANVSSATSAAAMPHDSALKVFGDPKVGWPGARATATARGSAWKAAIAHRHMELRQRRASYRGWLGAHSAVQNPDGTPTMRHGKPDDRSFVFRRADARSSTTGTCSGCAAPASDSYAARSVRTR